MPAAKDPMAREFYVYALELEFEGATAPFYVGMGHSTRASDRVRYVDYLTKREEQGKSVKWVASNRVVAECRRRGLKVVVNYLHRNLTQAEAFDVELQEIKRLRDLGFELANIQHNRELYNAKETP